VIITVSSRRIWKPPVTRKDDFFMGKHQQNKTITGVIVGRDDLKSSQVFILQQIMQSLNYWN
jgi:hypothetical protein